MALGHLLNFFCNADRQPFTYVAPHRDFNLLELLGTIERRHEAPLRLHSPQ